VVWQGYVLIPFDLRSAVSQLTGEVECARTSSGVRFHPDATARLLLSVATWQTDKRPLGRSVILCAKLSHSHWP
jgi:hypothetical protein